MLKRLKKKLPKKKKQKEIIPAHVHAQGHAQQGRKANDHVTRTKDASAVGPSPPLLAPVPGHIPSHGRVVRKDEDDPVLAHLVVLLRTTEVGGRLTDAAGRRLQEGGPLLGEGHRLAEGLALVHHAGNHVDLHLLAAGHALCQHRHGHALQVLAHDRHARAQALRAPKQRVKRKTRRVKRRIKKSKKKKRKRKRRKKEKKRRSQ